MKMPKKQARDIGDEILAGIREIKRGEIGCVVTYPPVAEKHVPVSPAQADLVVAKGRASERLGRNSANDGRDPMSVRDLRSEEVLQASRLSEYRRRMRIFSDELVYLHTNLSLLRQIADFDFELFGTWLPPSVKRAHMESVEGLLNDARPSSRLAGFIENLRSIRHADVAHLSRDVKLGFKTRPAALSLDEMQEIADCLGGYYNSVNFGSEAMFVLVQFHAPSGKYHERQLGYVFDRLALNSKWFRIPEEHPDLWPEYRAKLSSEELEEINAVGRRHRKKPLE